MNVPQKKNSAESVLLSIADHHDADSRVRARALRQLADQATALAVRVETEAEAEAEEALPTEDEE